MIIKNRRNRMVYGVLFGALTLIACGDPERRLPGTVTQRPDLGVVTDQDPGVDSGDRLDADAFGDGGVDQGEMPPPYAPQPGVPVEVDLTPYLEPVAGSSQGATVFESTSRSQLLSGALAHGSPGDFVLENEHVRVVIERATRAMSPCPYGGNVLDAALKKEDGELREDNLGEICLLANISQTFFPETFEIVQEGSAEEAAVLQVTGRLELLDFLNFGGLVDDYVPGLNLPIDLNQVDAATLTLTYILRPGDRAVRVVTALRNEAQESLHMVMGHLITGGGTGGYFNPLGTEGGFGDEDLDASTLDGVKFPFMVWRGEEASYAYVPEPDASIQGTDLPAAGVTLYASGASATLLRRDSLVATLLATSRNFKKLPGLFHLKPGESDFIAHQFFVGDGALNTMLDHVYPEIGLETGTIQGSVRSGLGEPIASARVSAITPAGRTFNQAISDQQGRYTMRVPPGRYTVEARAPGAPTLSPVEVDIEALASVTADLSVVEAARLSVSVRDPVSDAVPARVTVWCVGECPERATSNLEDVSSDGLPGGVAAIVPTGLDGEATLRLPPGDYRVTVSRGMEWSIWPPDGHLSGGEIVSLVGGELTSLQAEIAHVVETPGVLSGDFHIHGLTSTDSAVSQHHRVLDYLSEGVDVMVSTDHDFISDYGPAIRELNAESLITSLIGSEITTSDTGHLNAFPLQQDPSHPRGGALDWGNGTGSSLLPSEIFEWANAFPGEQVIQVNHPQGMGTIAALQVDVLRGISTADAASRRLPVLSPDAVTGDTRLWSESFTAMELMNDHSMSNYWTIARWWMTMVGRGFSPTMTAVTDSHRRWANVGGVPRTMVFVGEDHDTHDTFERDAFTRALNDGRAIGTNGPMFTISLRNAQGDEVGLGSTLDATTDGRVFGLVEIQMPEWIEVDSLDLYVNREDVVLPAGVQIDTELEPTQTVDISLDPNTDLQTVSTGQVEHKRWVKRVEFELTVDRDAYVIVMLRGRKEGARSMKPVLPSEGVKPFAFSNPIFVDRDGQGYDHPPLAELADTPPRPAPPSHRHDHSHSEGTPLTRELLWEIIDGARCTH